MVTSRRQLFAGENEGQMKVETIAKINFFVLLLAFLTFIVSVLFDSIFPIEITFTLTKASASLFVIYFVIKTKFLQERKRK